MPSKGQGKWQRLFPDVVYSVLGKLLSCSNDAIRRCTDERHVQYIDYGARGVSVYLPWLVNRALFVEHLLTLPGHNNLALWLDRRDNDGNYEPGNLRFVSVAESQSNQRNKYGVCSELRALRLRLGLSLRVVGIIAGHSKKTVERFERGLSVKGQALSDCIVAYGLFRRKEVERENEF